MRSPPAAESRRLADLLEDALIRERRLWKVPGYKSGRIQDVILWLGDMTQLFQFSSETFALGVCVLNRLLATVKAQPKYLKCIALTSLILAAKINEEDEVVGSVKDLVFQSGCNFSTAEILRMERIILDKLHWDLYTATPVDFVHMFHALLISEHPQLRPPAAPGPPGPDGVDAPPGQNRPLFCQAVSWSRQVQHCMACHQLWQFKGSTLALAIVTLALETLTPDWFSVFTDLLKKAQTESSDLILCKEMVDEYLSGLEFSLSTNAVYIFNSSSALTRLQEEKGTWSPRLGRWRRGGGGGGGRREEEEEEEEGTWSPTLGRWRRGGGGGGRREEEKEEEGT